MRQGFAYRPAGQRLLAPTNIKVKGLNVVPKASDIASDGAGWGPMWSNFDWTGWIKPQVDLAVTNGANCVKVTGSGATGAYPSAATFKSRVQQFLAYAVTNHLMVYWGYASTDWGGSVSAATPYLQTLVGILADYANVIGIDVCNEISHFGQNLSQAQALCQVAKAAGPLPVTASLSTGNTSLLTDSNASGIAPYVDFMDFHTYWTPGDPANSDFATYRAQTWAKPFLIGECGQNLAAGSTAQTNRWTALGNISTAANDCYGVIGFCIADYSATDQYGMYASDLTTARSQITTPFAAWPGQV